MTINRSMSMDDFAKHESSAKRERAEFLSWRKHGDEDGEGEVDVWLVDSPWVIWSNQFPRIARYEKDGKPIEKVFPDSWICMESDEELVKKIRRQGYRLDTDRDDSERHLATVDPFLTFLEWLRGAVRDEKIDWLDPVFEFVAKDSDDHLFRAAGALGLYPENVEDLEDPKEQRRLKELKIKLSEAFKEKLVVGVKYGFVVVPNANPATYKIALETEALGEAVKKIYRQRKTRFLAQFKGDEIRARDAADYVRKMCVRWIYDEKQSFSKKYDAVPLDDAVELTKDVEEAFAKYDEEKPDLDKISGNRNVAVLEKSMREHWCHDVTPPWGEIFEKAYAAVKGTKLESLPESFDFGANRKSDGGSVSARENEKPSHEGPTAPCTACEKEMPASALTCPHCGVEYAEFGGFIDLAIVKCEACGKDRKFADPKCGSCGREYEVDEKLDKVVLKPLPEPPKSDEPRASRRRQVK